MNKDKLIKSKKKDQTLKCCEAIELIEQKTPEFLPLIKNIQKILIDKYEKGDALAATFADEKIIVLTIPKDIDIVFLASILIHESTHINHYLIKPKEYSENQIKAEKIAFDNEIKFLKKMNRNDLIKEAIEVKNNLLNFLNKNKKIKMEEKNILKEEDINMTRHQRILDKYLME